MRYLRVILLLCLSLQMAAQSYEQRRDSVCQIAFWNVENLFYPGRDSLNRDSDYTPDGSHRWTYNRYFHKIEDLSRALVTIGGWQGLDLIGLCEVETDSCLIHLTRRLPRYGYVHYDSPDRRGIDCALLYHQDRIRVLSSRAIPVVLDSLHTTRDLLYVCARTYVGDTLHMVVCHLPSQWGGQAASEWKRQRAKAQIQQVVDSLYEAVESPQIIVMGDMNSAPRNDLTGLKNMALPERWDGTHRFQGKWTTLDQFYASPFIADRTEMQVMDIDFLKEYDRRYMGHKPRRTFIGPRYNKGVSDHYPIVLKLKGEK